MNYKELNDNELIYLCCDNNEDAINLMIDKYKNVILSTLKDYMKEYNIIGVEVSDLYQEGLIGLMQAIQNYDTSRDVLFYTYASTCIRTSIISAIRQTFRKKNRILNNSYSLDKLFDEESGNLYETFKDESNEPNKLLMSEEEEKEFLSNIKSTLSKSEATIFDLKLNGLSNTEISELLEKDKKYVENTLFRINKKYKKCIELTK